ncbi:MAG TPA: DMT family transporter [Pyrinomonadaceae bacterium]|jgi:drug/metabolite transporter (DMT)-like permease
MSLPARTPKSASRSTAAPHVALLAVQVIFGTWPILGKIALRALPSTGLVAVRVGGAALAFLVILRARGRLVVPARADLARLTLYSLLGIVFNQFLFVKGLSLSTAVNAALLNASIPVFTLVVSTLLGRERLTARTALGTLVAAAGVVYLIDPLRASLGGDRLLGNLMLVGNTFCYGAYLAVTRDVFRRYGALTAMAWLFAIGSVAAVPFGGYHLARHGLGGVGLTVWLVLVYTVLAQTVGAYYLNAWALERVEPSTVAVYIYLQPLFAFAAAPLLLGADEQLGLRHAVATALIFAGVGVVTLGRRGSPVEEVSEHPDAVAH